MFDFRSLYMVIVNYNLKEDTIECVESFIKAGVPINQIIIVDNGSTDDSLQVLRSHFGKSVKLFPTYSNKGYAAGVNAGVEEALKYRPNWVFVLNNDTIADPHILKGLVAACENFDSQTIFSPLVLDFNQPDQVDSAGTRRIFNSLITYPSQKGKSISNLPEYLEVDFISGCSMLFPVKVFNEVGFFDTSFFMYGEDIDFCLRCVRSGYRFIVATHSILRHKVSQSSKTSQTQKQYWRTRNQALIYRKYAGKFHLGLLLAFNSIKILATLLGFLVTKQGNLIGPTIKGYGHGWFKAV